MRPVSTTLLRLATCLSVLLPAAACTPYGSQRGGFGGGNGGSVLASVDGIDKVDRENDKVGFWLKCDSGVELKGEGKSGDKIRFVTASQVTAADVCWLEVRMALADAEKLEWEWFGMKKDKTNDVGLLYASTEDTVGDDRALNLTVYKLYVPKAPKPFKAIVKVSFAGIDAAKIPAANGAVASLVCGATSEGGGVYTRDQADTNLASFTFENLDATKMRGAECQKLVVSGADNKPAFETVLSGVSFPKPKKGDEYTFSKDGAPFVLTAVPPGGLDVDTTPGGLCLNKVQGEPCADVTSVKLGAPASYMVVRVKGIKGEGQSAETVTFLAGAGTGFGLFQQDQLRRSDLKLKPSINEAQPFTFYVYSQALETAILKATFDEDFVKGTAFVSEKASADDLEGVTLLHIDRVYVHGLREVTDAELDAKTSARWVAAVKAKKSDQSEVEMLVGGKAKYFHTAAAPASGKYFDFAALVADMKADSGSSRYSVYGLKGKPMAPAACTLAEADVKDRLRARHLGDLVPAGGGDSAFDACEVSKDAFDTGLEGAAVTKVLYLWDWMPL